MKNIKECYNIKVWGSIWEEFFISEKRKILVVDDEEHILRLMQFLLEKNGFEAITAENGSLALEKVISEKPDLILLDLDMPGMNGFDVLERVKESPATRRIPVIMLTANSEVNTFEKAISKEADRYVSKPFNTNFLMEKVLQVLEENDKK